MEIADLWQRIQFLKGAEKLRTGDESSKGELRASEAGGFWAADEILRAFRSGFEDTSIDTRQEFELRRQVSLAMMEFANYHQGIPDSQIETKASPAV